MFDRLIGRWSRPGRIAGLVRPASLLLFLCTALAAPAAAADSLRVLTHNMNRLFDDIDDGNDETVASTRRFDRRVRLAADRFAEYFDRPQIIALQEVENRNVLARIAAEIEARHAVVYRPLLLPGQDVSGINLAYLVRDGVEIRALEQLFRDATLAFDGNPLFSRPPLLIEACYVDNCLTLVNVHLRSMRGIDDPDDGARVRRKRLAQAEMLAAWTHRRQRQSPGASLLLLGDFNALRPSDAHVDVIGIVRGDPDNRRARVAGRDLVDPDLVDLTDSIPAERRYSFIFRRQKQQLDYMFANRGFAADVERIAFGAILYPLSDHAGLVADMRWRDATAGYAPATDSAPTASRSAGSRCARTRTRGACRDKAAPG